MFTITYTTENYQGGIYSQTYTEDTNEDAKRTFSNVCSSLRADFYAYCYCKFEVTLMEGADVIDVYGLSDMDE